MLSKDGFEKITDNAKADQRDYRAAIGPPHLYDVIGAQQFLVLIEAGLRGYHRLLDIGCGSLRGGRLFIPYLNRGNYFGIEPDLSLVQQGISNEIGGGMVHIKKPTFSSNDQCDTRVFGTSFHFALAQSVFTHLPLELTYQCLSSLAGTLELGGQFLFTFFEGDTDTPNTSYVHKAFHRFSTLQELAKEAGFERYQLERLDYRHPRGQTWVRAVLGYDDGP